MEFISRLDCMAILRGICFFLVVFPRARCRRSKFDRIFSTAKRIAIESLSINEVIFDNDIMILCIINSLAFK